MVDALDALGEEWPMTFDRTQEINSAEAFSVVSIVIIFVQPNLDFLVLPHPT